MTEKLCENCPAWLASSNNVREGVCRANPPTLQFFDKATGEAVGAWPPSDRGSWCHYGRRLMRRLWWR